MSEKLIEKLIDIRNEIAINENKNGADTKNLDNEIKNFLMKHCAHDVITDYIDITPNRGMNIKYCAKCGITL
jgi:hypothetical protein